MPNSFDIIVVTNISFKYSIFFVVFIDELNNNLHAIFHDILSNM